jgi:secernin
MWGCEHGVNEHRLAVGNEKVWTVDDPHGRPDALLGMDLVRLVLERARSADEALDVLAALLADPGQGGSGEEHADEPYWSSFLLVDPTGGWVVETSDRTWVARAVGDGAAISNRISLSTEWTRSSPDVPAGANWDTWRDPAALVGIADGRLAATTACVARGPVVGPADAVAALRDHGTGPWGAPDGAAPTGPVPVPAGIDEHWNGISVCMHVRGYQCTTASLVADLPAVPDEPVRLWASLGTPCTGAFVPVALVPAGTGPDARVEAVVADVLGDPEAWAWCARLSRAAETPGSAGAEALGEVRAALRTFEQFAWAEADDLWDADADLARWRRAAAHWNGELRETLPALVALVES